MRYRYRSAFTIIEMLVVVAIISLLMAILLPAIGRAKRSAAITLSLSNLRQLGQAHVIYASEWADQQFTLVNHGLSRYGSNPFQAVAQFDDHPPILLGWADSPNGNALWGYFMNNAGNPSLLEPVSFNGDPFGWFRLPNVKAFNQYLNGRFYDPNFYAPNDRMVQAAIEPCLNIPGEFCVQPNQNTIWWSSYCLSPAALYSPAVLANPDEGGWVDPWTLNAGLRTPSASQARHPTLKTHMLEHHWLQNARQECNPAFTPGTYDGCEPFYFNHAADSNPMTLFYDGHAGGLSFLEASTADQRLQRQANYGTWCRDTGMGPAGYFGLDSYDVGYSPGSQNCSYHILTTDGILGRDKLD